MNTNVVESIIWQNPRHKQIRNSIIYAFGESDGEDLCTFCLFDGLHKTVTRLRSYLKHDEMPAPSPRSNRQHLQDRRKVARDWRALPACTGDGSVGHGARMLNQGFHASQRLSKVNTSVAPANFLAASNPAAICTEIMPPKPPCICRAAISWPGWDSSPGYHIAFHFRAGFQPLRHLHGVTTVLLDAQIQRFKATNVKPGVERRWHSSGRVLQERHFIADFPVVEHHSSADHVGMSADVFGGGIYDHVGAIRQRMLQYRGCEGVVHHHLVPCA